MDLERPDAIISLSQGYCTCRPTDLNDVIPVVRLNTFQDERLELLDDFESHSTVQIIERFLYHLPISSRRWLTVETTDSTSIHVQSKTPDMSIEGIGQSGLLISVPHLEHLLNDVIAENVTHQL